MVDININRDSSIIYSQYIEGKKQNSLAEKETELTKEWHPTKNGYLRPNMISFSSAKKVWWLGKCGHEWQASVDNRRHGNGCPICAGFQVLEGYNDLATIFPELAKEWCLERNGAYCRHRLQGVPERKSGGFVLKGMNMNPLFPIEFLGEGALCAE